MAHPKNLVFKKFYTGMTRHNGLVVSWTILGDLGIKCSVYHDSSY